MTAPTVNYFTLAPFQQDVVDDIYRTFTPAQLVGYTYPEVRTTPPWYYSQTNYALAAIIIERATGRSYADALKKMLLDPLQLDETYYRPRVPPKRVLDAMASGYDNESYCEELAMLPPPCAQQPVDDLLGQDLKTVNLSAYGPAGGIVASLPDVTRWARALFSDQLFPPQNSKPSCSRSCPRPRGSPSQPHRLIPWAFRSVSSRTGLPLYGGICSGST
jgi:D-alanyl-D-alanine carboxypeptidase